MRALQGLRRVSSLPKYPSNRTAGTLCCNVECASRRDRVRFDNVDQTFADLVIDARFFAEAGICSSGICHLGLPYSAVSSGLDMGEDEEIR
jgi:hypothetical protein